MKIGIVLRELHRAEGDLALALVHASERHAEDHEVYHVARDIAGWSRRHVGDIAEVARRYDQELDPASDVGSGQAESSRTVDDDPTGLAAVPGLALLSDLRDLYLRASAVSVDWELVGQAAQAVRDTELLDVVQRCHPDTLRQARWANAKLKESSPQALVS